MNTTSHTTLAAAQQALLDALFPPPAGQVATAPDADLDAWLNRSHPQSSRGLSAYRANGHAMAESALLAAYPVVAAVLGADSFAMLARALWHRQPPERGDLAQWGGALPAWVQDDAQLAGLPWLADVARVEWALHRAASEADRDADPASFALLQAPDPAGLRLVLAPGLATVESQWPVASVVTAHRHDAPPLDEAWRRCRDGVRETALVWRQGWRPRIAAIDPTEATLLRLLQAGADLPRALEGACAVAEASGHHFDFGAWLSAAVQDGVVLGATLEPSLPSLSELSR